MKISKHIAPLLAVVCSAVFVNTAVAEEIVLSAPSRSDDGSYVLRVQSSLTAFQMQQQGKQLEVYRNKDGGDYRRILVGPRFSALSELVRENGTYGYKARWADENAASSELDARSFSNAVFVQVTTAVPRMVAPRKDKLAISIGASRASIN